MGVAELVPLERSKHSNTCLQELGFSMFGHSQHLQAAPGPHAGAREAGWRLTSCMALGKSLILLCLRATSVKEGDNSTHLAELL